MRVKEAVTKVKRGGSFAARICCQKYQLELPAEETNFTYCCLLLDEIFKLKRIPHLMADKKDSVKLVVNCLSFVILCKHEN